MRYLVDALNCTECGDEVTQMSPEEIQEVAYDPDNYAVYCYSCKADLRNALENKTVKQEY